jgi:hypothetical protein
VRKLLSIMVERQLVAADDRKYARRYRAVKTPRICRRWRFNGSSTPCSQAPEGLVEALLEVGRLTPADLRRLARRYGRRG